MAVIKPKIEYVSLKLEHPKTNTCLRNSKFLYEPPFGLKTYGNDFKVAAQQKLVHLTVNYDEGEMSKAIRELLNYLCLFIHYM